MWNLQPNPRLLLLETSACSVLEIGDNINVNPSDFFTGLSFVVDLGLGEEGGGMGCG